MDLSQANEQRRRYAAEHDLDVMYAETTHTGFSAWTYSDVKRHTFQRLNSLIAATAKRRITYKELTA